MSDLDLSALRVLVTGVAGLLVAFVVEELRRRGCHIVAVPGSRDYVLVEVHAVRRTLGDHEPDIALHLGAPARGPAHLRRHRPR